MTRDGAVARIAELAQGERPSLVVTLGVEMTMYAQHDPRFRALVDGCALVLCDTIGLLLASKARGGPLRERVTGADLIEPLAAQPGVRMFFFGGAPGVADRAAAVLRERVPTAVVAGTRDGFFAPAESESIAATIAASGANVLLAGLGSPKQEYWLHEHLAATKCGVGIGVGGSFDVLAGTVRRAPRLWRRAGFEWLYRLIQEPSRWRRQLALPRFALAAAREALSRKGNRPT